MPKAVTAAAPNSARMVRRTPGNGRGSRALNRDGVFEIPDDAYAVTELRREHGAIEGLVAWIARLSPMLVGSCPRPEAIHLGRQLRDNLRREREDDRNTETG